MAVKRKKAASGGDEIPEPMEAARKPFDSEDIRNRVLRGETRMGTYLKPLVAKLMELPPERLTESAETFGPLYSFFRGNTLKEPLREFTREDVLFLVTDPIGNLIRRPLLHKNFGRLLDADLKAKSPEDKRVKEMFIGMYDKTGWSRFIGEKKKYDEVKAAYPDHDIFIDFTGFVKRLQTEVERSAEKSPARAFQIWLNAWEIGRRYNDIGDVVDADINRETEYARASGRKSRFFTDGRHAFNQFQDIYAFEGPVKKMLGSGGRHLPPLVREATLLLVEDSIPQRYLMDALQLSNGLKPYRPNHILRSTNWQEDNFEGKGAYASAERALEVVYGNAKLGTAPPDVILSDIELLGRMNGLELVEEIYRREKAAGRKPMIMLIYSSNPLPYREKADELKRRGVIAGSIRKDEPDLAERIIEAVNEELKRSGGP